MYLHGSFNNLHGERITVHILTQGSRTPEREIGAKDSGIYFADDPVSIETSVNDTFDVLLRSEATIILQTRTLLPELFSASALDGVVNIYKGDECVFAGFIEPQVYEQGFNEAYDDLTISCIDALSALQYFRYADIGMGGVNYDYVKAKAKTLDFKTIAGGALGKVTANLDILGNNRTGLLYDGSKAYNEGDPLSAFTGVGVSESLFLGDDEDSVWTLEQTLEAILKYLNLHIVQTGLQFRIFSWETVKRNGSIVWRPLEMPGVSKSEKVEQVTFTNANVADVNTTMSVGEVFNQVSLTCNIEPVENVIVSPLDQGSLTAVYPRRMLYLRELFLTASHLITDQNAARYLVFESLMASNAITLETPLNQDSDKGSWMYDWYLQTQAHPYWRFFNSYYPATGSRDLYEAYCTGEWGQERLPIAVSTSYLRLGAALFSLGKVEHDLTKKDTSPVNKLDMTDYFIVAVNGNGAEGGMPDSATLLANAPVAVYEGPTAGGVYSPPDSETTNYIVFSGKICLTPRLRPEHTRKEYVEAGLAEGTLMFNRSVKKYDFSDGSDGIYGVYGQTYFKETNYVIPGQPAYPVSPDLSETAQWGLQPVNGKMKELEFKASYYSERDNGTDRVSKVPVLACMLIIGDKCVVETSHFGKPSDFEWKTFKERSECASDAEYYNQCFFIGFDPKIGDFLLGQEHDLQNNIDFSMNLDAEGMAIPIRKSDNVSGSVRFMVLGPVNAVWNEENAYNEGYNPFEENRAWYEKRTSIYTHTEPILPKVSNIQISGFEVKIYSDNGHLSGYEENDLIYMSDTDEAFINKKDNLSFDINSALTYDERQALGVSASVNISTAVDMADGSGVLAIRDNNTGEVAKPEQIYVDAYWHECHRPRFLLTQCVEDKDGNAGQFVRYAHPAMGAREFFTLGLSRNLREGTATLKLKEIDYD